MNCLGGRPCSFNPLWPLYLTATALSPLSAVTSDLLWQLLVLLVLAPISSNYTPFILRLLCRVNYLGVMKICGCIYPERI